MQNKDIKLSFDADGSFLAYQSLQDYARELIVRGFEVWIVTARFEDPDNYDKLFCEQYGIKNIKKEHLELFDIATDVGILPQHIKFMNMSDKAEFFKDRDFLWHIDDDNYEIKLINSETNTVGISCAPGNAQWRNKCERLIKNKFNEV